MHAGDALVDILRVHGSAVDIRGTVERITHRVERGERQHVSGLTAPDGMPLVWAGRWAGARIDAADPDTVWVGLGTPEQEQRMAQHRARVKADVLIGVGAAFDIHAGTLRQAPEWIQRSGLECSSA